MNLRSRVAVLFVALIFCMSNIYTDSLMTNAKSVCAYGSDGAYLVNTLGEIFRWNDTSNKWSKYAVSTPDMIQMDCKSDGTDLVGTDIYGVAKKWNGGYGAGSSWSEPRGGSKKYDWVLIDPVNQVTRGILRGTGGAWESWDTPTPAGGDPWDKYLPTGVTGTTKMQDLFLIETDKNEFARWERGDMDRMVSANRSGLSSNPLYIYYFGDSTGDALTRQIDPPVGAKNIDDVTVKQFSYDDTEQNLWCVDDSGVPWEWDNSGQEWIMRNIVDDEGYVPIDPMAEVINLLRVQDDFYVKVVYIEGESRPYLIIFKDSREMLFVYGEFAWGDATSYIRVILYDESEDRGEYHNHKLRPSETPVKLVRLDGGTRNVENHYLERLLIDSSIIADADKINVFPSSHMLVRR